MRKRSNTRRHRWWLAAIVLLLVWPATFALAGEPSAKIGRTTLVVRKMACRACFRVIDADLRKVRGILGLKADLSHNVIIVDHELTLTSAQVAAEVTASGYPARVKAVQTVDRRQARLFDPNPGFGTGPGCYNLGGANPVADSWRELCRRVMRMGRRLEQ